MDYKASTQHKWILALWALGLIYLSALIYIKLPFISFNFSADEKTGLINLLYSLVPKFNFSFQAYNLQILIVWLCGIIVGPTLGLIASSIYIIIGLIGIPVFSGGGGLGYINEPTFGYLISLPLLAYLSGTLYLKKNNVLAVTIPILTSHLIGVLYLIAFKQSYIDLAWNLSFSMIGYDLIFAFILAPFLEIISFVFGEIFIQEVPNLNNGTA